MVCVDSDKRLEKNTPKNLLQLYYSFQRSWLIISHSCTCMWYNSMYMEVGLHKCVNIMTENEKKIRTSVYNMVVSCVHFRKKLNVHANGERCPMKCDFGQWQTRSRCGPCGWNFWSSARSTLEFLTRRSTGQQMVGALLQLIKCRKCK